MKLIACTSHITQSLVTALIDRWQQIEKICQAALTEVATPPNAKPKYDYRLMSLAILLGSAASASAMAAQLVAVEEIH